MRALLEEDTGFNPGVWQEIAELGWLGIGIPDTYGGIGLGLGEVVPIIEQMGRHLLTTPYVSTVLAARCVARRHRDTKERYFAKTGLRHDRDAGCMRRPWRLESFSHYLQSFCHGDKMLLSGTKYLVSDVHQAEYVIATWPWTRSLRS